MATHPTACKAIKDAFSHARSSKQTTGQTPHYTKPLKQMAADAIRGGSEFSEVLEAAGVAKSTLNRWLKEAAPECTSTPASQLRRLKVVDREPSAPQLRRLKVVDREPSALKVKRPLGRELRVEFSVELLTELLSWLKGGMR